jgi:hypothetical protein
MLHRVALVRTDVSEEPRAYTIRLTRLGELRTNSSSSQSDSVGSYSFVLSSTIFVTLMMEAYVPPKCRFLQGSHSVTSQKTAFFC